MELIKRYKEIYEDMSQWEKINVVKWHIKYYLGLKGVRKNRFTYWKEILLTIKAYFKQNKYAVWFGQMKSYDRHL